jgi:hypothetical protein
VSYVGGTFLTLRRKTQATIRCRKIDLEVLTGVLGKMLLKMNLLMDRKRLQSGITIIIRTKKTMQIVVRGTFQGQVETLILERDGQQRVRLVLVLLMSNVVYTWGQLL